MSNKNEVTEGIFEYNRSTVVFCAIGIVFGIILLLAFPYLLLSGINVGLDTKFGFGIMFVIGAVYLVLCNRFLLLKRKVKIAVGHNGISAFCHIGGALDCSFSDVRDVYCLGKQLTICLRNAKRYKLTHLENAPLIAKCIRGRIKNDVSEVERETEYKDEFFRLRKKARGFGIAAILFFLAMFAVIIVTAALTGWQEMKDFYSGEWLKFAVMGGVLAVLFSLFIVFLHKYSLYAELADEAKRKSFKKLFFETAPLGENAVAMFVNDEHAPQLRAVVYYFQNEKPYFILEGMNRHFQMVVIGEPVEYEFIDELLSDMNDWVGVDVTHFKDTGWNPTDMEAWYESR